MTELTAEQAERINARLKDAGGDCIRWDTEARSAARRRHPMIVVDGKGILIRRYLYEKANGPLRSGYLLVPHCGDECCIAPEHQKQITVRQKNLIAAKQEAANRSRSRKVAAARRASGRVKLSMELAREIRNSDESGPKLARRLGVHEKAIWDVRHHVSWKEDFNPFAGLVAANDGRRKVA